MKQRISEILEPQSKSDFLSSSFNIFIISLIILNVLAVALETMRDVSELYAGPFKVFEWFSMAVFSIEYGLRVWTCTVKPEFSSPIRGRIRYMLTPSAIIDLVVVIPFIFRSFLIWICVSYGCFDYSGFLPYSKWRDIPNPCISLRRC